MMELLQNPFQKYEIALPTNRTAGEGCLSARFSCH